MRAAHPYTFGGLHTCRLTWLCGMQEKMAEVVMRKKQLDAREALVDQELQQREAAIDAPIRAAEEDAAARVSEAKQQVRTPHPLRL